MRLAVLGNAAVLHTRRWAEHFRGRGHDVAVWSLEPAPPGFAAHALPATPLPGFLRYPLALPALSRDLARFAPDLVDAHYVPNYGVLGALTGRRPLVVTAWGSDLLTTGRRDPLQRARARYVLSRADAVLTDAENLGTAARELGAAPARVHVVPWGVDPARFRPGVREPGLVLSTRMHETVYDLDVVVEAAARVLAERADARLVIAGDGSRRAALERLAARRLPAGRFTFVGRLEPDALAAWLGRADVYVSASRSDSTSLSLLEAMAAGALPVVSDIAGNREWVGDGDGARLFAVGDAPALAGAIARALDDAAFADAARARNARVIAERGTWSENLARIERLYEALVAERRASGGNAR
ncbi:MAG TPA: glycosyltransferase [Candidatus Saccharimonadaceae bacterium]|nr:glycosyltransferase [Candidatus Saccharimonadaceae bacterium]